MTQERHHEGEDAGEHFTQLKKAVRIANSPFKFSMNDSRFTLIQNFLSRLIGYAVSERRYERLEHPADKKDFRTS